MPSRWTAGPSRYQAMKIDPRSSRRWIAFIESLGADIHYGSDAAYYNKRFDRIHMPDRRDFIDRGAGTATEGSTQSCSTSTFIGRDTRHDSIVIFPDGLVTVPTPWKSWLPSLVPPFSVASLASVFIQGRTMPRT